MSVMQDVALDANDQWIKCVLNAKFIVFHTNFRKYLNFRKFPNYRKFPKKFFCPNLFCFKDFFLTKMFFDHFFSKNFSLLSRPLHCIKVICIETSYFT